MNVVTSILWQTSNISSVWLLWNLTIRVIIDVELQVRPVRRTMNNNTWGSPSGLQDVEKCIPWVTSSYGLPEFAGRFFQLRAFMPNLFFEIEIIDNIQLFQSHRIYRFRWSRLLLHLYALRHGTAKRFSSLFFEIKIIDRIQSYQSNRIYRFRWFRLLLHLHVFRHGAANRFVIL